MAAATSLRGGSSMASRPRSSRSVSASSGAGREPRRRSRRPATARTRRPRSGQRLERVRDPSARSTRRQHGVGSTLHQDLVVDDHRHATPAGIEREPGSGVRGLARHRCRCPGAGRRCPGGLARIPMGPPLALHLVDVARRAAHRRAGEPFHVGSQLGRRQDDRAPGSYPASLAMADPPGNHAVTTVIWFRVSVPVLSVQMKVVDPSVSTASRLRTSTCRCAICSAPHASERVTVGSRPSGTRATVTPMAKTNPSEAGFPSRSESTKNSPPTPTAMAATVRTRRCSSWVSGLGDLGRRRRQLGDRRQPGGRRRWRSPWPRPRPRRRRCRRTAPHGRRRARFALPGEHRRVDEQAVRGHGGRVGRDAVAGFEYQQVVDDDVGGIDHDLADRRGERSPGAGSRARSRSAAWSARFSCTKANTAFSATTMKMATPSWGRPARSASRSGGPQHEGEEVDELADQAKERRGPRRWRQPVGPVTGQPGGCLRGGEAGTERRRELTHGRFGWGNGAVRSPLALKRALVCHGRATGPDSCALPSRWIVRFGN